MYIGWILCIMWIYHILRISFPRELKGGSLRILSIVNQKGGSGKTTTTVNLGAALAEQKRSVLIVDLDAQCNTTDWFGTFEDKYGVYEVLADNVDIVDHIHITDTMGVSLVPASKYLSKADKDLTGEVGAQTLLRDALKKLKKNSYDYVLFDCPPALGIITINALSASNEIIIPVETNIMALKGVVRLLETFEAVRNRLNPKLAIAGVVACRVEKQTRQAKDAMRSLKKRFGPRLFKTVIRKNIKLSEAPSFQQPITAYDPNSHGAKDYLALAKELIRQEG